MDCETCGGTTAPTFELNPDPLIDRPVRGEGNNWLLPRRATPDQWFIDELQGFDEIDPDELTPGCRYHLEWYDDQVPDPDNDGEFLRSCGLRLCEPACTTVVEWNSGETPEPPDPEFPNDFDGALAIDVVDPDNPCKTHDYVCDGTGGGRWIPTCAGSVTGTTGVTVDEVCYDVSGFDFPQAFSQDCGEWLVFGDDQMAGFLCSEERVEGCAGSVESDGDAWNDSGASAGPPSGGWNALPFAPAPRSPEESETTVDGCSTDLSVLGANGYRATYRVNFDVPSGSAGPLNLRFDHYLTAGQLSVALYDIVSGDQLPVSIIAQPSGAPMSVVSNAAGPYVRGNFAGSGPGVVELSFTLPAGVDAANVRALVWNFGGSSNEAIRDMTLAYTRPAGGQIGCFTWNTPVDLAAWLNSNDPNGPGWIINGDTICRQVTAGAGIAYGNLAGCDDQANVSVTQITTGGMTSNQLTTFAQMCALMQQAPAGVPAPGATQIWLNPDGTCVKVSGSCRGDWPTAVEYADGPAVSPSNAADFVVGSHITEVCVVNGPTGTVEDWTIQRDTNGDWQWHHRA